MSYRILVTARSFRDTPGEHHGLLKRAGCQVVSSPYDRPLQAAELEGLIGEVDGVILGLDRVTAEVMAAGKRLKVLSRHGVGLDNIDLGAATQRGIVVTYTPGANRVAVAELTVALMLCLARRIPQHWDLVRKGGWQRTVGLELLDKTLGVIGLGNVGREVIARADGFGMRFLVHTLEPDAAVGERYRIKYVTLQRLLAESDFVSLHCSLGPDRAAIIGREQLRAMKPTAYLINTGRGELVDEGALYQALVEGWIAGAACDVLAQEPPQDNPLLTLDCFIATPHMGASTEESVRRMGLMAAQNALLVLEGKRPIHVANPEVYSRV